MWRSEDMAGVHFQTIVYEFNQSISQPCSDAELKGVCGGGGGGVVNLGVLTPIKKKFSWICRNFSDRQQCAGFRKS